MQYKNQFQFLEMKLLYSITCHKPTIVLKKNYKNKSSVNTTHTCPNGEKSVFRSEAETS